MKWKRKVGDRVLALDKNKLYLGHIVKVRPFFFFKRYIVETDSLIRFSGFGTMTMSHVGLIKCSIFDLEKH